MSRERRAKPITRAGMLRALLRETNVSNQSKEKTTNSVVALCGGLPVFECGGRNRSGHKKCLYAPSGEGAANCRRPKFSFAGERVAEYDGKQRPEDGITQWCQLGAKRFRLWITEKTTRGRHLESKGVSADYPVLIVNRDIQCEHIFSVEDFAVDFVRAVGSLVLVIVALVICVMATLRIRSGTGDGQ